MDNSMSFFAGAADGGGGLSGAAEAGSDGDAAPRAPSIAPLSASSDVELAEAPSLVAANSVPPTAACSTVSNSEVDRAILSSGENDAGEARAVSTLLTDS